MGQVNQAFEQTGDERAAARPETGAKGETFIDMRAALVSVLTIGPSLLGANEYTNLQGSQTGRIRRNGTCPVWKFRSTEILVSERLGVRKKCWYH